MFLSHGNETFWYCQNKTRKSKQSVLILPSQNQHISFKMFWFQSECIFLWGKKTHNIHLRCFRPALVLNLLQEPHSRSRGLVREQRTVRLDIENASIITVLRQNRRKRHPVPSVYDDTLGGWPLEKQDDLSAFVTFRWKVVSTRDQVGLHAGIMGRCDGWVTGKNLHG